MVSTGRPLDRQVHTREAVEALAAKYRTWGRWGPDDELGSANYVTPARIAAAAASVRRGAVFALALPLDRHGPMRDTDPRVNPQHLMLRSPVDAIRGRDDGGLLRSADDALYLPLQCSTQWDAFAHIFYDGRTYNGRGYDSVTTIDGATHSSIANLADRAIGRGVLLDVARQLGRDALDPGDSIQGSDLQACADDAGVEVGEGDFVLVRTGHLERRRANGDWGDFARGPAPGLGVSCAEFLCERHVVGVATDTWALEAIPYECEEVAVPLHVILLVYAGVYIGEMWDLEALAADCATDGVHSFFLNAVPLNVTGGVGSPVTPIAIK